MRRILFVFLFLISLNKGYLLAQEPMGAIKGKVQDIENEKPVFKAELVLFKDGKMLKGALTDQEGNFLIENLEAGEYLLKVKYFGERHSQKVLVESGKTIQLDLIAISVTTEMDPVEIFSNSSPFKKLTGTATELSNETIQSISPMGTQEILKYVPGVFGAADDGMGNSRVSIGIRGLHPRRSSRVLLLEDGIPVLPAIYIYPNAYYNPPVERIHEIEVIKGSGSIKYGPQTMGGVINYITNKPRRELGGVSQLVVGTNGYLSLFTEIGGWGTKNFNPEVQLLYKRGDGYRENNSFDQLNGTFKANIFFSESKSLYLKYNINYEKSEATYTGLTEYSFRTNPRFNPKKDDLFTVLRNSLDLIYTNHINERLTSTSKVYANMFDREWWRENDVFVDADTYDGVNIIPVEYFTTGNLIRVGNRETNFGNVRSFYVLGIEQSYALDHKLFGTKSKLEVGGRYYWERFIDNKLIGSSPDARNGVHIDSTSIPNTIVIGAASNYETSAFSGYLQEHWNVTEKLSIVPGVRLELFEESMVNRMEGSKYYDTTMFVILPGIGMNYEIGNANIFAGVHRGYTPPSSSALQLVTFRATKPFDLKPEKSWNYELGVRSNSNFLNIEIAGFLMNIEDIVVMGAPASMLKNLGRAMTYGVENNMKLSSSKWWKGLPDLNVSYTLLYTEVKSGTVNNSGLKTGEASVEGKELPYAPRHTLVAGISKNIKDKFIVRVDYTYVSKVYTDLENIEFIKNRGDTGPVPLYYLLDASMSYKINKHWKVSLTGKNILDKVYIGSRLHSDPYTPGANQNKASTSSGIIPGARRQINLAFRYEF